MVIFQGTQSIPQGVSKRLLNKPVDIKLHLSWLVLKLVAELFNIVNRLWRCSLRLVSVCEDRRGNMCMELLAAEEGLEAHSLRDAAVALL